VRESSKFEVLNRLASQASVKCLVIAIIMIDMLSYVVPGDINDIGFHLRYHV